MMLISLFLFMRRLRTFVIRDERIVDSEVRRTECWRELCQLYEDLYYHCISVTKRNQYNIPFVDLQHYLRLSVRHYLVTE